MVILDWIGKKEVIQYIEDMPYRELNFIDESNNNKKNILINHDNLEVLKSLIPMYKKDIKCIYIDPPYNTGSNAWIYNDNVNSPYMKKWINAAVGKEGVDLDRHDKWLSMMYPRIKIAKQLLHEEGVIFVSIDDTELANLRMIMDEVFGKENMLACFIWKSEGNFDNQAKVKINHEYIIAYTKDINKWNLKVNQAEKNIDNKEYIDLGTLLSEQGSTQQASYYLDKLSIKFDYPKPVNLIKHLISMVNEDDFIVLDFFAGSGTTAEAVMQLNEENKSKNIKYILIELEKDIFDNIILKRLNYIEKQMGLKNTYEIIKLGDTYKKI